MTFRCIGCGKTYGHKTGLSNHWRVCDKWKNFDKKRRLEMQTLGPNLGHNLQVPSETPQTPGPGPVQPNDLSFEVRKSLLLCIIID